MLKTWKIGSQCTTICKTGMFVICLLFCRIAMGSDKQMIKLDRSAWIQQLGWGQIVAEDYGHVFKEGVAQFYVKDPNRGMRWSINTNIDIARYKYLAMRYKAANIVPKQYAIYVKSRNRGGFVAIGRDELICDGKWHIKIVDLSTMTSAAKATFVAVGLDADSNGNSHLCLSSLGFFEKFPLGEINANKLTRFENAIRNMDANKEEVKKIRQAIAAARKAETLESQKRHIDDIARSISDISVKMNMSGSITLGNKAYSFCFDKRTGAMTAMVNKLKNDNYLKCAADGMRFLKIHSGDSKKEIAFRLVANRIVEKAGSKTLYLKLLNTEENLEAKVGIRSPGGDAASSEWSMELTNLGKKSRKIDVSFPHFQGITLVDDEGEMVGVAQWLAQVNRNHAAGIGIFVKDKTCLKSSVGFGPSVRHKGIELQPGKKVKLSSVQVTINDGNWKEIASSYHDWFKKEVGLADSPKWFSKGKYKGIGIRYGCQNRGNNVFIHHFSDLPKLLDVALESGSNVIELAGFGEGETIGGVFNGGDYFPRKDMGGTAALREGIRKIHQRGGRVIFYVEGLLTWPESEIARSGKAKKWALMDKDGKYSAWYHNRWHQCSAATGWQDYMAKRCAKLIRDTDADGIRLDSYGATITHPCYNPSHKHKTPYVWEEGVVQMCRKVKQAITAVKPDAVLLTEGPLYETFPWVDGALIPSTAGSEGKKHILLHETFPEITLLPYNSPSGNESAKASVYGFTSSSWYARGSRWDKSWYYAQCMFRDAFDGGVLAGAVTVSDKNIIVNAFKAKDYYLIAGTRSQGIKSDKITIALSDLKEKINKAYLLDVTSFSWRTVSVSQQRSKATVSVDNPPSSFAIFLPLANCRAIVSVKDIPQLLPGQNHSISLSLQKEMAKSTGKIKARVMAPGLVINGLQNEAVVEIPGKIILSVPKESSGGMYGFRVVGKSILEARGAVKVKNPLEMIAKVETEGSKIALLIDLKNNRKEKTKVRLELKRPKNWKLPVQHLTLLAGEKKTLKLYPQADWVKDDDCHVIISALHDGRTLETGYRLYEPRYWKDILKFEQIVGDPKSYLLDWWVSRPFENKSASVYWLSGKGFDVDCLKDDGGEKNVVPQGKKGWREYRGVKYDTGDIAAGKISWDKYFDSLLVDLCKITGKGNNVIAYAGTTVTVPKDTTAVLRIRTDSGVKVWINHSFVYQRHKRWDYAERYQDEIKINLKKGSNLILLKVGQTDRGFAVKSYRKDRKLPFSFTARLTSTQPKSQK